MHLREHVTTKDVLIALRSCTGLLKIEISFNGSGDSGQIDHIGLFGMGDEEIIRELPLSPELKALYAEMTGETPNNVVHFIEQWIDDEIGRIVDFDWYNNDGGGGTITIEPYTGKFVVDAYQNITTTEPYYYDQSITDDPAFTPLTAEQRALVDG